MNYEEHWSGKKIIRNQLDWNLVRKKVVLNKIYSLPSDEWMLIEPIDVILKISDNETIALIPDLELYSEGSNEIDAISELKFEILDLIDDLFELIDEDLGQAPKGWKKSLKQIVKKCQ